MHQQQKHKLWSTRALNTQDIGLKRSCKYVISKSTGWQVQSSDFSVEFPSVESVNGNEGKIGTLDILAKCRKSDFLSTLLVKCKKHHPDLADWIFLPTDTDESLCLQIDGSPVPFLLLRVAT